MIGNLVEIVIIDLILSGDNAILIGIVASNLTGTERRNAIYLGAGAAVVLRIALAAAATQLLELPFLAALGGLALFWVGWRLLHLDGGGHGGGRKAGNFRQAVALILLADVVMSLDNILAVAGAAHGNIWLLIFGLALSIPLLFIGSGIIANLTGRLPLLIYVGAAIIFRIGAVLILEDQAVAGFVDEANLVVVLVPWLVALIGPLAYVAAARARGRPVSPLFVRPGDKRSGS